MFDSSSTIYKRIKKHDDGFGYSGSSVLLQFSLVSSHSPKNAIRSTENTNYCLDINERVNVGWNVEWKPVQVVFPDFSHNTSTVGTSGKIMDGWMNTTEKFSVFLINTF